MTPPKTPPTDQPYLGRGTDISADPAALGEPGAPPATSDPDEMTTDDPGLGGVGGPSPGGAG
ncbi:MAG: hypothetical protein H7323_09670 [Frankiales bacterium]|nr:hypothetical protein [Frankiales bacterium]